MSAAKGECQEAGEGELNNTVVRCAEHRKMNLFKTTSMHQGQYVIGKECGPPRYLNVTHKQLLKRVISASPACALMVYGIDGLHQCTGDVFQNPWKRHDQGDQAFKQMEKSLNISNKMSYGDHISTNTSGTPLQLDTPFFFNLVVHDRCNYQ